MNQAGKDGDIKKRIIINPSLTFTVIEMVYGLEFVEYFLSVNDSDLRFGDDMQATFKLIKEIETLYKVPIDFSSYDQTIPSEILATSFTLLRGLMTLSPYEERVFWTMVSSILHIPIYHSDIGVINRKRGIISGSYYTNIMDSFCNLLILHYCDSEYKSLHRAVVYGDDNLLCGYNTYPNLTRLQRGLKAMLMSITTDRAL